MRKKKIDEAELPSDNLAVYQLVDKESGGIVKDFVLKLDVPPQTIQRLFKACLPTTMFHTRSLRRYSDTGMSAPRLSSMQGYLTVLS